MKYFLIGFMGSGKTTIGKNLSKKLDLEYIDLDQYIEKSENQNISEIFGLKGEKYFRKLELKYLKKIIKRKNLLISTGGGTPIYNNLINIMNQYGCTIYLECSTDVIYSRLKTKKEKRPLISNFSNENLKKYIEKKISEREDIYKQATHIINNDTGNCIDAIIEKLG